MSELKLPYLNSVTLVGRLVADPHTLKGKDDMPGVAFTLAVNRWVAKGKSLATFVDCVAWQETAKAIIDYCAKGSPVLVAGSLGQYTRKNGKTESKVLQVSVATCQFLSRKPEEDEPPAAA